MLKIWVQSKMSKSQCNVNLMVFTIEVFVLRIVFSMYEIHSFCPPGSLPCCPHGEGQLLPGLLSCGAGWQFRKPPEKISVIESLAPLFLPQAVKGNSPDRCHWGRQETTERESNHPWPSHFGHVLQSPSLFYTVVTLQYPIWDSEAFWADGG